MRKNHKNSLLERAPRNKLYLRLNRHIMNLFLIPIIVLSLIIFWVINDVEVKNRQAIENQVEAISYIITERIHNLFDKFKSISSIEGFNSINKELFINNPDRINIIISLLKESGIDESCLCSIAIYDTVNKDGLQVYGRGTTRLSINEYFAIPTNVNLSLYSENTLGQAGLRLGNVERFYIGGDYHKVFSYAFSPFTDKHQLLILDFDMDLVKSIIQYSGLEYAMSVNNTNEIFVASEGFSPDSMDMELAEGRDIKYSVYGDMLYTYSGNQAWRLSLNVPKEFYVRLGYVERSYFSITIICMFFAIGGYMLIWIGLKYRLKPLENILVSVQNSNEKPITELTVLKDKIIATHIGQKEAQIASLQNQINPHFLYNTLDTIRGAAIINNVPMISEMAKRLSLLFRYSMQKDIEVSIKSELNNVEDYLTIQNFRHDNKFKLMINAPVEIGAYKILRLTLQPFIENCIKHGLENKVEKGFIKIDIRIIDEAVNILITDNGNGIRPDKIKYFNDLLQKPVSQTYYSKENKNVGLINVNARIKLYYGHKFGVRFIEIEKGACVELTIPTQLE